ncbi:NAD(P)-dependent oxidoreductase [Brachybacterium sp. p3-SID957]|uniref:NAD(P)-dependent oxidoreductase n=1 Tax=Brachybacterium sp. p3-SID957 TaxID=2916049 RepID=UPI00223C37B5|nr:NAD(P)-binding oxidoreductase [Brachybacterium sp. p3-SID957]MCT1775999.1 SDR family oxidoreductase [Brachybacterium sp. p3-SID957]
MQITIVGGAKGTGAQLATLAIEAGHVVTVVTRSGTVPEGADRVLGSASDPAVARLAVTGADAVVVTVGGAKGVAHNRAAVTRTVIEQMKQVGVRRLLVQSSLGAGGSAQQMPLALRLPMKLVLAKPLADHEEQEAAVMASGLDWTIVRPSGLTDKPAAGSWQTLETSEPGTLRRTIPRADLAACMLEVLEDDATIGSALGVSS